VSLWLWSKRRRRISKMVRRAVETMARDGAEPSHPPVRDPGCV
jgi:hypothetical protein